MPTEVDRSLPGSRVLRPATPPAGPQPESRANRRPAPADPEGYPAEMPDAPEAGPMAQSGPAAQARPAAGDAPGPGSLPARRPVNVSAQFRPPASHRPPPPTQRLLGLWAWATGIGAVGSAVALRGLDAVLDHAEPAWYEPTQSAVGLSGVALMLAAFLSAERRRLPWVLLGLATVPTMVNLGLTVGAL